MPKFLLVASVLPCAAAAAFAPYTVVRPTTATSLNGVMSATHDPTDALDSVKLDEATVKAAAAAADSGVEVLRVDEVEPSQLRVVEETEVRNLDQYGGTYEAASFFDALLTEREATCEAEGESNPIETGIKEKVRKISFLQSELDYVISSGLASESRRKWLVDKAALEEQKRECKQQWVCGTPSSSRVQTLLSNPPALRHLVTPSL